MNVEDWRERLAQARADSSYMAAFADNQERRKAAMPEIAALFDRFDAGEVPVDELRYVFDTRTRTQWDVLGLKGLSGAMFLNQLVKHLPDHQEELATRLRALLSPPNNAADGKAKLEAFHSWLKGLIAEGVASGRSISPGRLPFFTSAVWHLRGATDWPIYYQSARDAIDEFTEFEFDRKDPVASYLAFRTEFARLQAELGCSHWELARLCARLVDYEYDHKVATAKDATQVNDRREPRTWLYAPGQRAMNWDENFANGYMTLGSADAGDLSRYEDSEQILATLWSREPTGPKPNNAAHACWQFAHEMEPGDEVIVKRGRGTVLGFGKVAGAYEFDPSKGEYPHRRKVVWWAQRGELEFHKTKLAMKTLTDITRFQSLVDDLHQLLAQLDPKVATEVESVEPDDAASPYRLEDALEDLFLDRATVEDALQLLARKKNLVLQGPPGVGKTFVAQRLAYALLGAKDKSRVSMVQFHQSYAYEDFVQGYRPSEDGGFARSDGPFLRFASLALQDDSGPYVLIIDEINRANLSKVFGELLMLLEADKRSDEWALQLAYSREGEAPFFIPDNLYIIGTMNTADRSLALVDYALRRRFAFVDIAPRFGAETFGRHLAVRGVEASTRKQISQRLAALNQKIGEDQDLGAGFQIGHSYFCDPDADAGDVWFERVVKTEVEPLLREYWFDSDEKVEQALQLLLGEE